MKRGHLAWRIAGMLTLGVVPGVALAADVAPAISAQGVLRQSAGGLQDGVFMMTFRLYDAATGGTARYQDTQSVDVDSGVFSVTLGPAGLDPTSFRQLFRDYPGMWLEVEVQGDPAGPLPRISLGASPYAFHAQSAEFATTAGTAGMCTNAQSLGGLNGSDFQRRLSVPQPLVLSAPGGPNLQLAAGCGSLQILKFVGGAWICSSDETGNGGGVTYTAAPPLEINGGNSISLLPGGITGTYLAVGAVDSAAIADQTIQGSDVFPGTLTGFHLLDGTINTADLADSSISNAKLQDGVVTASKLAADAVSSANISNLSITSADLADGAILTAKIVDGAVTNSKLAVDAVGVLNIQDNAVSGAKILDGTVSTLDLADSSITTNKLADGAVNSAKILDLSIATGDLADSSITSAKIQDLTVATADLADSSVNSAKILDLTIATGDLADSAVTNAKLADNAVTSAKIQDLSIATGDLADNAVTNAKLADNAVSSAEITDLSIATADLADNAITNAKLADNAVSSAEITDLSIATADLADNAVNSAKILDGTITNADLSAGFTVNDAALSANIARLNGAGQSFTQGVTFSGAGTGLTVTNAAQVGSLVTSTVDSRGVGITVNMSNTETFSVFSGATATPDLEVADGVVTVDGNLQCVGNVNAVAGTFTGVVQGGSFSTTGAMSSATVTATGAINGASVTATGAVQGATVNGTTSVTTPQVNLPSGAFSTALRAGTNSANAVFALPPANATVNASELIGNTDGTTSWRSPRSPVEAASAVNDNNNSTTDLLLDGMQLTGLTGTYVVTFNVTVDCDANNRDPTVTIYSGGAAVAATLRTVRPSAAGVRLSMASQTLLTGLNNTTVEVRGRVAAGNCNFRERSIIAMPF